MAPSGQTTLEKRPKLGQNGENGGSGMTIFQIQSRGRQRARKMVFAPPRF